MVKEYIMKVNIDEDGYEWGLKRVGELVRCGNCLFATEIQDERYCKGRKVNKEDYCSGSLKKEDE